MSIVLCPLINLINDGPAHFKNMQGGRMGGVCN